MVKLVPAVEHPFSDVFDSKALLPRDFSTILDYGISRLPFLTEDWTDWTRTDPGILYLVALGSIFDKLNFMLDKKYYNNVFKYTSKLNSLLSMASYLGVDTGKYTASITVLKLEIANTQATFTLPRGFRFKIFDKSSGTDIILNNIQDEEIEPGENFIICIEGEMIHRTFKQEDFDSYNSVLFDYENVAYNSFHIISQTSGDAWYYDPDVLMTEEERLSYSVYRAKDGKTKLTLMPGFRQFLALDTLDVSFTLTKGTAGNIKSTASMVEPVDDFNDYSFAKNAKYYISIDSSQGGADLYDVNRLKYEISKRNNATYTLTQPEDFNALADEIDGVYSIAAQMDSLHNYLYYVKSDDINDETAQDRISEAINGEQLCFTDISMEPIIELPVSFGLNVVLIRNYQETASLTQTITEYLEELFSKENQNPGTYFSRNKVSSEISKLNSVINYVTIDSPINDIDVKWNEIIIPISINITYSKGGIF